MASGCLALKVQISWMKTPSHRFERIVMGFDMGEKDVFDAAQISRSLGTPMAGHFLVSAYHTLGVAKV